MKKFWFCQAQIWYEIQDWSPNQTFCYRIGKNKVFHSCELLKQSSSNYSIKCKLTGNDWKALYFWVLSKVFLHHFSHLKGFNFKCNPLTLIRVGFLVHLKSGGVESAHRTFWALTWPFLAQISSNLVSDKTLGHFSPIQTLHNIIWPVIVP